MTRARILLGIVLVWVTGIALFLAITHAPHRHHDMPETPRAFVERLGHIAPGMSYDAVVGLIGSPRETRAEPGGTRRCEWYIGRKGEGEFFDIGFGFERTDQFIVVIFDRRNRVVSKQLRESFIPDD